MGPTDHAEEVLPCPCTAGSTGLLQIDANSISFSVNRTAYLQTSRDPSFDFSSNIPVDGVSSKLSNKGFLNHAGMGPLSKKTAARGPLSRYELEAELRTTIPERQRKEHHAGLKGRERRHEQAVWEQQRLAAPHRQASQKPRVHPKEAMPLMVWLRPAGSEHSRQS